MTTHGTMSEAGVARAVAATVRRTADGGLLLSRREGWLAAALPSGDHLADPLRERIARWLGDATAARLWAVLLEDAGDLPALLPLGGADDLDLLNRRFGFLNLALVATTGDASEPDWVLVCTTDDYLVALAPPEHLAMLTGGDAAAAFAATASDPAWPDAVRRTLERVAVGVARYDAAAPGQDIQVPEPAPAG